ncbi:MAG: Ig-like domain-containing protein [Candidatus Symbiothrix sp.]|jgi:hypothetical protein|nr:Ig-like domain-containing protein [Candidatus Symbiothrix sp.]
MNWNVIADLIRNPLKMVIAAVYLLLIACGCYACASIASPEGGDFDYDPPEFVGSEPKLGATLINKNKIVLTFDEYIVLEKPNEKVIITPPQKKPPVIKAYGKHISVELKDSLIPNTTYTFDFTDAISDNNEKNTIEGFTYAFSTGNVIDSLVIAGCVLDAENLEPMPNIMVGIHSDLSDTAFTTLPFLRTSQTNESGRFWIRNVPPGTYHIFALSEQNRNFRYDQPGESIAFDDSLIVPSFEPAVRMDTIWRDSLIVDTLKEVHYTRFTPDNIVLRLFKPLIPADTTQLADQPKREMRKKAKESKQDSIQTDSIQWLEVSFQPAAGTLDVLDTLKITFSDTIQALDLQVIQISQKVDTLWQKRDFPIVPDSLNPLLYYIQHDWSYGTEYRVQVDSAAIVDIHDNPNKPAAATFKTPAEEFYAHLYVQISGITGHGFGQLLDASGKVVRQTNLQNDELIFENLKPTKYYLRYIDDWNDNGQWDTGDYATGLQPEPVYYFPVGIELKGYMEHTENWNVTALPVERQKPAEITKNKPKEKQIKQRDRTTQKNRNTNNNGNNGNNEQQGNSSSRTLSSPAGQSLRRMSR